MPATSEELIDMITFAENARTTGMIKLNRKITVSTKYKKMVERCCISTYKYVSMYHSASHTHSKKKTV